MAKITTVKSAKNLLNTIDIGSNRNKIEDILINLLEFIKIIV